MSSAASVARHRGASRDLPRVTFSPPLILRGVFALAVCVVITVGCHHWLAQQQVSRVSIEGNLNYINKADLRQAIEPFLTAGMLNLPIRDIQQRVLTYGWVDSVSLQKRWPDTLYVLVTEQRPVARWQTGAYLNYRGEEFFPDAMIAGSSMPLLDGGDGYGADVLRIYQQLSSVINVQGLKVVQLRRSAVGGFYATLSNGIELALGSSEVQRNINKFAAAFDGYLNTIRDNIDSIDLRYGNGLAVSWLSDSVEPLAMIERFSTQGKKYE